MLYMIDQMHSNQMHSDREEFLLDRQARIYSKIAYLKRLELYETEKPCNLNFPVDNIPGARQTNVEYEYIDNITIVDIRGIEQHFHLDTHGFQVFHQPFEYSAAIFRDASETCRTYCWDMELYLQKLLVAEKVYIYDSQVCCSTLSKIRSSNV